MLRPHGKQVSLSTRNGDLRFENPVGLGAGFDKNARYLRELDCMGFGFVEIGTVTPLPQDGNEKPRLFRLPADRALINRMGFNNDGAQQIAERLKAWRATSGKQSAMIIGGNIGKNKITPNEEAWRDYAICFDALFEYVDYFTVNVSSPNTPGLRALQDRDALQQILTRLQEKNNTRANPKPIFLKIAPDLSTEQVAEVIALALDIQLDGIVATNTTISRENLITAKEKIATIGAGGLSGLPVQHTSTAVVRQIARETNGTIPIIASGGIFNGADAAEKLKAGATLVQVWTGFIYEGPGIIRRICRFI